MVSLTDADPQQLTVAVAGRLKERGIAMPEWARFVRTGPSRQRPPQQDDWWQLRGASLIRKVYRKRCGVSRLRKAYSGRENRGHKPEHRRPASGKIIRTLLKQLEAAGLVATKKGSGRFITPAGQKFLDGVARDIQGK